MGLLLKGFDFFGEIIQKKLCFDKAANLDKTTSAPQRKINCHTYRHSM